MSTCFSMAARHLDNFICYCTVPCLVFEMEIKYDDDDDDDGDDVRWGDWQT